jgi:beta-galactosidase
VWAELLVPDKAEALAFYDHPVFGKYPAVTRNRFGRGTLTYEGTYLSEALQDKVVTGALKEAGVPLKDAGLPAGVRAKHAVLADGSAVHAYFNFSGKPQTFVYRFGGAGVDVLTGSPVAKSQAVTLPPWDLVIIKE